MSDKKEKNYSISIIIEHNTYFDPFEVLSSWLKTNITDINLEKNALLNNPSFRFINPEGESIKIKDVREFNRELSFPNYDNKKRYFIFFNSDQTTLQAQNATLKSIEEPPINTQIVFLTSTLDKLLPTIISRCEVVSLKKFSSQTKQVEETSKIYEKILKSRHYELIELANSYKDRKDALILLNNLLNYLHKEIENNSSKYKKAKLGKHSKTILKVIQQLEQNINVKLAIENCFFSLIE